MADRRLAIVGGFLFCGLVLMLLLILYYPETSNEDDSGDLWTPKISIKSWNNVEDITEAPEPESKIAMVARVIEDMGASFLALLAVFCVAAGLACLTCACCCCAA